MNNSLDLKAIVVTLAAYVLRYPRAVDSAEGIRRWWMDEEDEVTMNQMQEALRWMLEQSLLEEVRTPDGRRLFKRAATDAPLRALAGDRRRG